MLTDVRRKRRKQKKERRESQPNQKLQDKDFGLSKKVEDRVLPKCSVEALEYQTLLLLDGIEYNRLMQCYATFA